MSAKLRIKCPSCGSVENAVMGAQACPKCNAPLNNMGACIYLYRQGSVYGVAGGFGVYIDGEAYGHIGNKETLCIPVSFGTHTIHSAVGMSRKCQDLHVTLTPENPTACAQVYIKPGFWANSFVVEPLDPKLLDL